jgi:hypothetical protein
VDSQRLLDSIRIRAALPVSQASFLDADLLALADEETADLIVPHILATREDFFMGYTDFAAVNGGRYRIPARAIGNKLRGATLVQADGYETPLPRSREDRVAYTRAVVSYLDGPFLVLKNASQAPTIRLWYYVRPSSLVLPEAVGIVSAIDTGTNTVTLSATPPASFVQGVACDFYKAISPFDTTARDVAITGVATNDITFASLPTDLEVGDHLALAGQCSIPQMPSEFHPVLAQAVAVKALESIGDVEALGASQGKLGEAMKAAIGLISDRDENAPQTIVPYGSPWLWTQRWWRPI